MEEEEKRKQEFPERKLTRRERRYVKRMNELQAKVIAQFSVWDDKFHNQFANALAHAEEHDNDIFAIFDRYWRLYAHAWNVKARKFLKLNRVVELFDVEYFTRTHMDHDPNSPINKQAA